ncbi:MAG TPA: GH3 auxin-responsive promoter family protein [Flavipsychrobacter sp.]|nr:GH3 auxin-responsive promoter family protein [Flavipsychrobacter sp.]
MGIINPTLRSIMKLRQSAIDNFVLNPIDTQQKVFNDLIGSAQFTEFGKKYGFEKINTIADFKRNVPINNYDTLKPYIQRILEGEQNILWPSPINWFAKSSGTTSDKSKFIPISKETLDDNHFKAGKDVHALYLAQFPDANIFNGKCLVIGGSAQVNQLNADSFYGDLSAVMIQNMPFTGQILQTPSPEITLMDEWEAKIEKIASTTVHDNVTYIAGVPTWIIVLIKRLFELNNTQNLHDIWPGLELYIHGGVNFKPYRKQFESFFPNGGINFLETYNASEGFFAAQDEQDSEGLLLFLNHGIYFEFLPVEEYGKEHPQTLSLKEVELGKQYAIVISTNSGLWRYIVGDTVQFTSLSPYRIKVTGRLKHFINAFGEELIIDNADYAITKACEATGAIVTDYTAAPIYMSDSSNGAHEWLIEFAKPPHSLEAFTIALDNALKQVNSDYEAKRTKDIALRMPVIHSISIGCFQSWLRSKGKLGGQHKVPRLSNERTYLEEILKFSTQ